jgi:hypothetical protein
VGKRVAMISKTPKIVSLYPDFKNTPNRLARLPTIQFQKHFDFKNLQNIFSIKLCHKKKPLGLQHQGAFASEENRLIKRLCRQSI